MYACGFGTKSRGCPSQKYYKILVRFYANLGLIFGAMTVDSVLIGKGIVFPVACGLNAGHRPVWLGLNIERHTVTQLWCQCWYARYKTSSLLAVSCRSFQVSHWLIFNRTQYAEEALESTKYTHVHRSGIVQPSVVTRTPELAHVHSQHATSHFPIQKLSSGFQDSFSPHNQHSWDAED